MSTNPMADATQAMSDEELTEVSGGAVVFSGRASTATALDELERACKELGGNFSVMGNSSSGYAFSCSR